VQQSPRTADLTLSNLLRQVSNGSFREAATQRLVLQATAAKGRSLQVFLATGKPSSPKSVALAQIQPSSCRVRRLGGRQLNTFQVLPEQQGVKPYDQ